MVFDFLRRRQARRSAMVGGADEDGGPGSLGTGSD